MSKLDDMVEPETASVHRLEVISGSGRRRSFSDAFKARGGRDARAGCRGFWDCAPARAEPSAIVHLAQAGSAGAEPERGRGLRSSHGARANFNLD